MTFGTTLVYVWEFLEGLNMTYRGSLFMKLGGHLVRKEEGWGCQYVVYMYDGS
jgi:hypothetical protein